MISLRSNITRQVLAGLFLKPQGSFYVNELARRLKLDSGNLTRKLHELESAGLLKSESRGREKYYSLDPKYPLFQEYRHIVMKTVGVENSLKQLLKTLPGVQKAYIFGSYAEDRMDSASDIDLLVVGAHKTMDLQRKLSKLQRTVSREINVISLSSEEYESKRKNHDFFKSIEKKSSITLI